MMAGMITLILTGLLFALRTRRTLVLENLALRHQLAVLQRAAPRPRLGTSDRLFWVLLSRLWSGWADAVSVVQPATVIRWQRTGFNQTHLRRLLRDYLAYYHSVRTHLSLDKDAPQPRAVERPDLGRIVETPLVGGLHHRYGRLAA